MVKVAEVTGVDISWLAFGSMEDVIAEADRTFLASEHGADRETVACYRAIIEALPQLDSQDIRMTRDTVAALSHYRYKRDRLAKRKGRSGTECVE
jgi:hypothetical protein